MISSFSCDLKGNDCEIEMKAGACAGPMDWLGLGGVFSYFFVLCHCIEKSEAFIPAVLFVIYCKFCAIVEWK